MTIVCVHLRSQTVSSSRASRVCKTNCIQNALRPRRYMHVSDEVNVPGMCRVRSMSYSTPAPTIPCAPYFSKTVNITAEASGATISGTERASHRRQTARKVEYGITARKECALGLWRLLLTNDIGVASPGHLGACGLAHGLDRRIVPPDNFFSHPPSLGVHG